MKRTVTMILAVAFMIITVMPASASIGISCEEQSTGMRGAPTAVCNKASYIRYSELKAWAAEYGLLITCNEWLQGNGAISRKVYAAQGNKRIAILLQWEDATGNGWFTVSTENRPMNIDETMSYLKTHMLPRIIRTCVGDKKLGIYIESLKNGDTIRVRQFNNRGRVITSKRLAGKNGWLWLTRNSRAVRANIAVSRNNVTLVTKTICF